MACSFAPSAVTSSKDAVPQRTREELVKETHAMLVSVSGRVSERDLAASIASEHVALLNQRAEKLRARCERMAQRERAPLVPHLDWLAQVYTTTTLSIGMLRNESRDLVGGQAEVLLWTKVFITEIQSLETRVDRVAPMNVLLTQRSIK